MLFTEMHYQIHHKVYVLQEQIEELQSEIAALDLQVKESVKELDEIKMLYAVSQVSS